MNRKIIFIVALCCAYSIKIFAQQKDNAILSIERNSIDSTPTTISFNPASNLKLNNGAAILKDYLQLADPNITMTRTRTTNPYPGIVIDRYIQYYKNIKVAHGSYTITAKNDIVNHIHGCIFKPTGELSIATALSEAEALQKALDYTGAKTYMWQDAGAENFYKRQTNNANATYYPSATKVWVEDFSEGKTNKELHLAYSFNIYAKEPLSRKWIYVDANTGKILLVDAIIKHIAASGNTLYSGIVPYQTRFVSGNYILEDTTRGMGVYTGTYNNTSSTTSDVTNQSTFWSKAQPAIDAHWGATNVYDYWNKIHNRKSYDDADSRLNSYVNYSSNYNNAYWDGYQMTYGDGSKTINGGFDPLTSLDVCGHEIGHGVCEYTANLVYQQESGALNEGLSDIWGETIEHYAAPNKPSWQIGAEIGRVPLRSMSNPKFYSDPDTYNGTYWVFAGTGCNMGADYCGVHTNSGVLNKWYYLLTVGGSGTNDVSTVYKVAGIGWEKAAKITYATELTLASTDNFAIFRTASIAAATTLYGACSAEVEAVTRAWNAVNVGTAFVPCGPQIGFVNDDTVVTMDPKSSTCPSSVILDIPVTINALPVGGSPIITIVDTGSAKAGVDYNIAIKTATFPVATLSTQHIFVEIFNHGAIDTAKVLTLKFNVAANGSNAVKGNIYHEYTIVINNKNTVPQFAGDKEYTVGQSNQYSTIVSPFFSAAQSARSQFIIYASDLIASGIKSGTPISHIGFNVVDKKSTRPFTGFTIKLGHTTQTSYTGAFITTGLTTVYNNSYSTAIGWNKLPLSTTFSWDGVSNIVCEVCFANTSTSTDTIDKIDATNASLNVTAYNFALSANTGCALTYSSSKLSNCRPLVQFTQQVTGTSAERVAPNNKIWTVSKGQNVYFYHNTTNKLIANISSPSKDLGCVTAAVSVQGNGFSPLSLNPSVKRSVKEFTITPTINATGTTYAATIYYDTAELGTMNLANVRIVKTNAAADSLMNSTNTQIILPVVSNMPTYVGYSANFTGFSRFFITDNPFQLTTPINIGVQNISYNNIHIDNNPFRDKIYVSYSIATSTNADILLFDITGRLLYKSKESLSNNNSRFTIDLNHLDLATGNYVLQIITPNDVVRQKMVKE